MGAEVGVCWISSGFSVPTMFSGIRGPSASVSIAAPAPVLEHIAPALAVIAAPAPVVEYIAPAPAGTYAAPAPPVLAAQAPAVTYAAPAPTVTCAPTASTLSRIPASVEGFSPAPVVQASTTFRQ